MKIWTKIKGQINWLKTPAGLSLPSLKNEIWFYHYVNRQWEKADLMVCELNGMEDHLVSSPISSRPVCSWQQGWMFKESQTQRPGETIRVTTLNCCKPNYEAFLPSTFCTEPAEHGEGDQGHTCGKHGWQGQCVDCGAFLKLEVKVVA